MHLRLGAPHAVQPCTFRTAPHTARIPNEPVRAPCPCSSATRRPSMQEHFDCAVGTMQGVVDALAALAGPLEQVTALAQSAPEHEEGSAAAALVKIRWVVGRTGATTGRGVSGCPCPVRVK